jgi:SAM-dependent methyltransferase
VRRFAAAAPGGTVLDVACGSGRHVRWLAAQGFAVTGVDRDDAAVAPLQGLAEIVVADLEGGPWPLPGRRFDAVVVTNYLWRPLWPRCADSLADGGVLIYETFAHGQQPSASRRGRNSCCSPGELLRLCAGLRVVAFEDGFDAAPARYVQRIAAVSGAEATAEAADPPFSATGLQGPAAKIRSLAWTRHP